MKVFTLYYTTVGEDFPEGEYDVLTRLTGRSLLNIIDSKNTSFSISGTKQQLRIELFTCKDVTCYEKAEVFLTGENVFVTVNATADTDLSGSYSTPSGKEYELRFTNNVFEISPAEIGTYAVKLKAEKEGYLPTEKTVQFGIIEKSPQIEMYVEKIKIDYKLIAIIATIAVIFIIVFLYFKSRKGM
jgi:hypothetical protein